MTQTAAASRLMVLMFTDLVGSMEIKTRHGVPAYATLIARHDQLFHAAMHDEGGAEAEVLQDTGDGYFARFPTVSSAVRCALRFQHDLAKEAGVPAALKVRIGIHLGETAEVKRDSSMAGRKVAGLSVDLTARIMGLATGGQILMTRFAFNEARQFIAEHPPVSGETPPTLQWIAHGNYVLKGMEEAAEVFEVGAVGVAPLAPPPDSEKAKREAPDAGENTLGWRPAIGLEIPSRNGWTLEKKLGEGGFGEVWLGRQGKLRGQRVFKFCFDPDRLRSFKREITLFRLLRDVMGDRDDIARLHDVKLDGSPYFLESEYTEGGNLVDWSMAQGGIDKVPLETRLEIVARVATALHAAHTAQILHKDIKPSNILVYDDPISKKPRPRLADFGIGMITDRAALKARNITDVGFTLIADNESSRTGTRMYAPPETLAGKPFTAQGDIYALGVLLYQMVLGDLERPLATGWDRDVADELLREDIRSCVDGNPSRRLFSAEELATRLSDLPGRRKRRARERLIRSGSIGAVLTIILIIAYLLGWLDPLEQWCYGRRAAICQFNTPAPTDQIVHLDIDDVSIAAIGRWPWPRAKLAQLLDEIHLAGPKVVGLDITLDEPQTSNSAAGVSDDDQLAAALDRLKCGVLAASFTLTSSTAKAPEDSHAVELLSRNLAMTQKEFSSAMSMSGSNTPGKMSENDLFLISRRQAFHDRIATETRQSNLSRDQLLAKLLPQIEGGSPLVRLFDETRTEVNAAHGLSGFGVQCPTLPEQPPSAVPAVIPLTGFSSKAAGCGFVDCDLFNNSTLSRIPLFVEYDNRLYPQFGVVFGLKMLGADVPNARPSVDQITVPRPDGPDVVIPAGTYHSRVLHRNVAYVNPIPWFGTADWLTMYDRPGDPKVLHHISINHVWDICNAGEEIVRNCGLMDDAQIYLLTVLEGDKAAKKYATNLPPAGDFVARESPASATLKDLGSSGLLLENYAKDAELSEQDKLAQKSLTKAKSDLEKGLKSNRELINQITSDREWLAAALRGKGVLIGSVATANGDLHTTSLHERCPGVVINGVIANAVITGRWWHEAPGWVAVVLILMLGLGAAFIDARLRSIWSSVMILTMAGCYLLTNGIVLFGVMTLIVPIAGPVLALMGIWLACNLAKILKLKPL
jgi:CHASE2 domain-containing sensor protein/class 3 adenylate cyclase